MSLVFIPKIAESFREEEIEEKKVLTVREPYKPWTMQEINTLKELRAIGCSYRECGELLEGRTKATVVTALEYYKVISDIKIKRKQLINSIMEKSHEHSI